MAPGDPVDARIDRIAVPDDADGFLAAHPRMHGSFHRTGGSSTPTAVTSADSGTIRTTSTEFGFPIVGELCLGSGFVGCGVIVDCGRPLRWQGIEGTSGEAVYFRANVEVPVSIPGGTTVYTVSAPEETIRSAADDLGVPLDTTSVQVIGGPSLRLLECAIVEHRTSVAGDRHDERVDDELLRAFVHALDRAPEARTQRARRESSRIVARVVDHVEAHRRWRLSTLELCRVASASERRLQLAFQDMYDVSPQTFLRDRALSACRDALLAADADDTAVSTVALDHDFSHLSRFASAYREAFGEFPSETLRRRP